MPSDAAHAARYASIVVDAQNGEVIYGRHMDKRRYPASLTKIMTLYMVFEALEHRKLKLDQKLTTSKRAAGQTPSVIRLKAGEKITVKQAILAVTTKSANDAATVLAEALGGTEFQFAMMMTERARQLGMKNTTFRNATGLPNRRQRTTARDMAKLARAIINRYPSYYRYFSNRKFTWRGRTYSNTNSLLRDYKGTDGIKTGYIRASGFNLAASAQRGEDRLVGVVFGGKTAVSRDKHMAKLLNNGFRKLRQIRAANASNPAKNTRPPLPKRKPGSTPPTDQIAALPQPASTKRRVPVPRPQIERTAAANTPLPAASHTAAAAKQTAVPGRAHWGIQVGAFKRLSSAQHASAKAAAASSRLAPANTFFVRSATGGDIVYRARFAVTSGDDAAQICRQLRSKRIACAVVLPNGSITGEIAG